MAKITLPVSGTLIALVEEPYSFVDADTQRLTEGVSRRMWIRTGPTEDPAEVKFRATGHEGALAAVQEAGEHATVQIVAAVQARANRASLTLDRLISVEPGPAKASK